MAHPVAGLMWFKNTVGMAPQETLKLFVDVLSPFSFLAYTTVRRYQQLWNVDLQVKPVLLAGLMAG